jgi:hypothetical protein
MKNKHTAQERKEMPHWIRLENWARVLYGTNALELQAE